MSENCWKWKKLEQLFENFWDFLDWKKSKIFIGICMKMKKFEIKNFRNFSISKISKCSLKIVWKWKFFEFEIFNFFDLKKFQKFSKSCSNFFHFQKFSISKIFKNFQKVALTFFIFKKSWWFFLWIEVVFPCGDDGTG